MQLWGQQGDLAAQQATYQANKMNALQFADSVNTTTNRKYNLSITPNFTIPVGIPQGGSVAKYSTRAFGIRYSWRPAHANKRFQARLGLSSQAIQGTVLSAGASYLPARENERFMPLFGVDYAFGLGSQKEDMNNTYTINVGYNHYVIPFIGFKYKPGLPKAYERRTGDSIRQRFTIKLEVGYSMLISRLQFDTTGTVPRDSYDIYRKNIVSPVNITIAIGFDIPSRNRARRSSNLRAQSDMMMEQVHQMKMDNEELR